MGIAVELQKKYLSTVSVVSSWDYIVSLRHNLKILSLLWFVPYIITIFYGDRYGIRKKCLQIFLMNLTLFVTFESNTNLGFLLRTISFDFSIRIFLEFIQDSSKVRSMVKNRWSKIIVG